MTDFLSKGKGHNHLNYLNTLEGLSLLIDRFCFSEELLKLRLILLEIAFFKPLVLDGELVADTSSDEMVGAVAIVSFESSFSTS
mmetsp:Transcript_45232/g.94875  ORF Transcript_45232/g.94875 Transcript_45232/m.94875 type:complete len:84 (-) Transcript_45232:546-797(-)